jgi:CheY-like chemotaxis protein
VAHATARLRGHQLELRNISLRLELHPAPLGVLVNREEIQQVVLNLVGNAEHAIGDQPGSITIRTTAGEHAHTLQVIDDGPGISAELRGRVFEPFFTTKEVGEGTGLGLSIALGIATAHGGSLALCGASVGGARVPEPGSQERRASSGTRPGACFQLTLPAHVLAVSADPPAQAVAPRPAPPRRRLVLIIEDEVPIRSLLARLLDRRGFDVVEAGSCAQAKAVSEGKTFDLVLCDVRLGDGNGGECLRHLRVSHPGLERRFIFVTGDIAALSDQSNEFGGLPVLAKPFAASDLDRVLGDVEVGV